ncbi:hypothetical protein QQ045_006370 [Rhodiola kirilowii]
MHGKLLEGPMIFHNLDEARRDENYRNQILVQKADYHYWSFKTCTYLVTRDLVT